MAGDVPAFVDEPVVDSASMTDRELLIRMDGKLSASIGVFMQGNYTLREEVADHENRIRSVEKKLWYFSGGAALLAFLVQQFAGPLFIHK